MLNKVVFDLDKLNLASIAPMALLIAFAVAIICLSVINKNLSKKFYTSISILALLLDFGLVSGYSGGFRGFFNLLLVDGVAILSMLIILLASAFFIALALCAKEYEEYEKPEFYALFLFMIAGYQFMVSSDSLILIFVGLETSSLALYTLIALRNNNFAVEAALKYFTMGALSAGFFAFGGAMFYLVTGSVEIHAIASIIKGSSIQESMSLYVACLLLIASIGFKISLIPFHTWLTDVYEGSNAALAGFISIVPKVAAFVVALRLFNALMMSGVFWVEIVLYVIAVLTMSIANVAALVQKDVKRMLAFSSVSHAGFLLAAIVIGTTQASVGLFLYWIMFVFANLGAFTMLWVTHNNGKIWDDRFEYPYEKFSGLIKLAPCAAIMMAIFMLSLAGIPPFSVFWGKMYLMSAAVNSGFVILAVIMAVNSAIALYYYLRVVVEMFLKEPIVKDSKLYSENLSNTLKYILALCAVLCVIAPIVVKFILPQIYDMVIFSGF
ncbi:NADH-quinone oxidoreductase subunit NuoN [Campylobacter geochelonis]|uniref:NADH-quinone oxidoreductase subunit N n=1 Tax=Campylobacter geochelonis TaxID=1780362 RepID=A0A128EDV0_9BACT|nr:NADH-quinone oxidoreductase subunit NuoN [Campylobacter geochelonis]QKF70552.1 NADH:quinone oxidoreductase I, membrane subunit N [Campylobacter geochelonis]CZE46054.1 NADH dehydrogenase subunit N [Campylobacter geochelonis]CZE46582.1 NADH dehydrogenase subunit N [Campylobacter geochelonis]CZE50406.1 NADH dehydrogenase subunit N [Campylobacter geochelonis]